MKNITSLFTVLLCAGALCAYGTGPTSKRLRAERISSPIKVDGVLDDAAWGLASAATDFIQFEPVSGGPASHPTEVRIVYDDRAIYVGAHLHDQSPDSILRQLSRRDIGNQANADDFSIAFDTYDDNQNAFSFGVSASGVQTDTRFSALGEDQVWDAVWKSAVQVHDKGWTVEMEIPYSALRFSSKEVQDWGLQIRRTIRRKRETLMWNPMDRSVDGVVNQFGTLEGLSGLKPPFRMAITPYVSGYVEKFSPGKGGGEPSFRKYFNAGADLKFGLSEAFTLDLTLVPDFGQVVADNQVLNLSPFEVQFKENRQFFTEGTELFSIANLFYTRRLGGRPRHYFAAGDSLGTGESISANPSATRLVNAFKLSGRTKGKTGIGVFNGMTAPAYAKIQGPDGDREVLTQDFTNYNVAVVDQNLRNNSFVSLINTNRLEANGYIDNVTAARFNFADAGNKYFFNGSGAVSQIWQPGQNGPALGHAFNYKGGKASGNLVYELGQNVESDTYNPTGMGYLQANNEVSEMGKIEYRIFKPVWKFVSISNEVFAKRSSLYAPYKFSNFEFGYSNWLQLKSFDFMGLWVWGNPGGGKDFFEARVPGRQVAYTGAIGWGMFVSSNYGRRFAIDINLDHWGRPEMKLRTISYIVTPRVRISDRISLSHTFASNTGKNEFGFVGFDSTGVSLIGVRTRRDLENILSLEYTFTNKMAFTLRTRHIWSGVHYHSINALQDNGQYFPIVDNESRDINFNVFNVDAVFQWRFAPGSDLFVVWKTNVLNFGDVPDYNYFSNVRSTFDSPQTNSVSVRWLYYLDLGRMLMRGRS